MTINSAELRALVREVVRDAVADLAPTPTVANHNGFQPTGPLSADAKTRVALMRLAWDFIGSEFGSRHQQYEKFYGGASFLVKQNVFRNFDFARATGLVDAALTLPEVEP